MNKRLFYIPMMLLAVASCEKVQEEFKETREEPVVETHSLVVNAVTPETKVTISEDGDAYKMSWDGDEEATLILRRYDTWQCNPYHSQSSKLTGESMSFSFGELEYGTGTTAYDILYPRSAYIDKEVRDVYVALPAAQTPKASTADPAAALLYGRADGPEENDAYASPQSTIDVLFKHMAAYGKMTLLGVPSEETISSIAITAEDSNIAGEIIYHAHSGIIDYNRTSESTITLKGTNLTANPAGFDVWFACKPFTLAAGKTLTIVTVTDITTHTAVLTAKAEVAFEAGKVTELPAYGDTHTVTFNSMGGSAVASAGVVDGRTLSAPAEPLKAQSLAQGLYLGDIDDPENGALFAGWYTDAECTSAYDFATPVTSSFTLYAKWETRDQVVDLSANDTPYHAAITTVNGLTLADETVYTLVIDRDVDFTTNAGSLDSANAVLKIIGKGTERTIHATGITSNVLSVNKGKLVLGNNLRIYATDLGNRVLVSLDSETAKVQMEDGCRLSGSTGCTADAIVVKINSSNSEFIMNGGEISNNSGSGNATRQATILNLYGVFTMNGGVISNNTVETNLNTTNVCGGVMFNGWTYAGHQFTKTGGEIKDNTAARVSATGDETGLRGQQVLLAGRGGTNDKKIDYDIGSAQNLNAGSCWSSPWENAAL